MPVEHMVWFKFKPGVDQARIDEHARNLLALRDTVPGVVDLCVGENFTDRAAGHTFGLLVTLDNRTSLENYLVDDLHVAVAGPLKEDCESVLAFDFEH